MADRVAATLDADARPGFRVGSHTVTRAAGGALGVAVAIVALHAVRRPLTIDEAAIVATIGGSLRDTVGTALETDPAQTGTRALLFPLVAVDAPGWALRLPSILAVLLAAALGFQTGRALAGRVAGIVAGSLLGLAGIAGGVAFDLRPHALALVAVALSTALFVTALTRRSRVAWVTWAGVSALLPLAHPVCAAAVVAQALAVGVDRRRVPRLGVACTAFAITVAGLLLAAAAIDRSAAAGAGDESFSALARALGHAAGWSPVAVALALWGVVVLARRRDDWQAVLLAGLVAGPVAALLVGAALFPVVLSAAVAPSAVGVALAAGVGVSALVDRRHAAWLVAAAVASSVVAAAVVAFAPPPADWRAAAGWIESQRTVDETVVVLPARARPAYAWYAPEARVTLVGRGGGVWVVLRATRAQATAAARDVVATPRYALLEQRSFGDDLVVEHWVRP